MPETSPAPRAHVVDLHVHTTPLSSDSALSLEDSARHTVRLGLSALCLTEHNNMWTSAQVRGVAERWNIPVIRGMEVGTDAGHVLVFGVEGFRPEMCNVHRLRRIVESEGAAMILAHPAREPARRPPLSDLPGLFHALEALNGDENGVAAELIAGMARSLGMPTTGGSDAHSPAALGRCATRFSHPIRDERSLVEALRRGLCEAIQLQNRA